MERVLVVLHGPVDVETMRACCSPDVVGVAGAYEVAICRVLPEAGSTVEDAVRAQRAATTVLRAAVGSAAEGVAVFVAWDMPGYRVEDCAREWGATLVRT